MFLTNKVYGESPANRLYPYLIIVGVALVGLIIVIANPGYFSHDELQKLDHVNRYGLEDYLEKYLNLKPGDSFGTPVRPLSFMVQGFLALLMEHYTVLVHLFSVLSHAAVACLFYAIIIRLGGAQRFALVAALVFVLNPMTMLAVGWSAALMDRLYILWGLLALLAADVYIRRNGSHLMVVWVLLASSLAVLSKETAVILPGLLVIFLFLDNEVLRSRRIYVVGIAWFFPVLLIVLHRLAALTASFGDPSVASYRASVANIPDGLLVYFGYPFVVTLTEALNWVYLNEIWLWGAVVLHVLLVAFLHRILGLRIIIGYLFFYFLFLVPVLLIPMKAAHYLYGSGMVLSAAIAYLLVGRDSGQTASRVVAGAMLVILLAHTMTLQLFVYRLGVCMNKAVISSDGLFISSGMPSAMDFQAEPGAPEYVLHRIFTGREQIGKTAPVRFTISAWDVPSPENALSAKMNKECVVSRRE